jgi:hypothetical protein
MTVDKTSGDGSNPLTAQLYIDYGSTRAVIVVRSDGSAFTAPDDSVLRVRLMAGLSVISAPSKHTQLSVGYSGWLDTSSR